MSDVSKVLADTPVFSLGGLQRQRQSSQGLVMEPGKNVERGAPLDGERSLEFVEGVPLGIDWILI